MVIIRGSVIMFAQPYHRGRARARFVGRVGRLLTCLLAAILLCLILSTAASAQPKSTFMVSPVKLEIKAEPGETRTETVMVVNQSEGPIRITSALTDYYIRPNNSFVFSPPGSRSYSSAKWITLSERGFDLPPGETKKVKITISVPSEIEPGGRYAGIFFQTTGANPHDTGVKVVGRIGVLTLIGVGSEKEIVRRGEIIDFDAENRWFSRNVKSKVTFLNRGNVHLTLKGQVIFWDMFGREVGKTPLPDITILPKSRRIMSADWVGPWFGRIGMRATVSYGRDMFTYDVKKTSREITFWIIPWQLILGILGAALVLHYVRITFYKKATRPREIDATLSDSA